MPSCCSSAPTAMISGLFAGAPTKPTFPARRSALLPAAAMIRQPFSSARAPAAEYGGWAICTSAPSDIDSTGQRLVDRPVDAGEDLGVAAAAGVAQHLAGEDLGLVGDAVARSGRRRARPARGADAVGAVAVPVLDRLPGDERLGRHVAAGEVRVGQVEPGVEHRDADVLARASATTSPAPPGCPTSPAGCPGTSAGSRRPSGRCRARWCAGGARPDRPRRPGRPGRTPGRSPAARGAPAPATPRAPGGRT